MAKAKKKAKSKAKGKSGAGSRAKRTGSSNSTGSRRGTAAMGGEYLVVGGEFRTQGGSWRLGSSPDADRVLAQLCREKPDQTVTSRLALNEKMTSEMIGA